VATTETSAVLSIHDALAAQRAERDEARGREYLQIRRDLDIGSFAVNAVTADQGKHLVDERTALGYARDAHEELYVLLSGRATFTVEGETHDAAPGTAVFVRDPEATRAAVSDEDGTTLLIVGGRRGEAWRPTPGEAMQAFMPLYEGKDYEGALRVAEQVLDEYPGNGLALYNVACMESLLGRGEDALGHLREALDAAPELLENARTDEDFASLRGDRRFAELVV
jgi:tetratricopeptide (TPR) repeat protein